VIEKRLKLLVALALDLGALVVVLIVMPLAQDRSKGGRAVAQDRSKGGRAVAQDRSKGGRAVDCGCGRRGLQNALCRMPPRGDAIY
jgi:hypothetical protein